ncbi:hypothetical protein [Aureibacter tunicatorum]|uniref:Uncharacterized protein n=1 Tax=Aureibacter tunicatorum TaxID=866807 RepID=A0AAE4BSW7_9BACT|nr:hypothetical protein [Aureibacter tunicatorum]MDR6240206.1 hypothetical protein [Aureibacter tunicatorum]BDD05913.1 hypothetical protein AUTU_33960 [Aureibacter tunicatorum]
MYAIKDNEGKSKTERPISGKNPVIQRAVGFEFGYPYWWLMKMIERDPEETDEEYKSRKFYRKGDCIHEANFWKTTADTTEQRLSYMEIITDPFNENDHGIAKLNKVMDEIDSFLEEIMDADAYVHPEGFVTPLAPCIKYGKLLDPLAAVYYDNGKQVPTSNPQATAGVRLDKISELFLHLGADEASDPEIMKQGKTLGHKYLMSYEGERREKDFQGRVMRWARDNALYLADALQQNLREPVSSSFVGFATMILFYLVSGHVGAGKYAKSFITVLARTDFATMFKILPTDEKEILRSDNGAWWMSKLVEVLPDKQTNLDEPFFAKGIFLMEQPILHHILKDLTKKKWLTGILEGVDYLTEKNFPNRLRAYELESMGAMGDKTDVVFGIPAPIFELRGGKHQVDMRETKDYAINTLKFMRSLHHDRGDFWGE